MKKSTVENIELNLLLDGIYHQYGYDFRNYAKASVERRAKQFCSVKGFKYISEMIPQVLRDEQFFESLVKEFSITVTELFRDPFVYKKLVNKVFPLLKTYPFVRIWHAGCATGEEVYSMAILLKEKGLYNNSRIYATDFNDTALETARQGIYSMTNIQHYISNYQKSGGSKPFSEYYNAKYDSVVIDKSLKKNITFANHNLATDGVFGEMNLIMCRNVLIYFDKELQNRVLNLFSDSLTNGGYLCLGTMESLLFTEIDKKFELIEEKEKIYQKKYISNKDDRSSRNYDIIAIGVSAGGLTALSNLFSSLTKDLQVPIIVTQHLSPREESDLAEILNHKSSIKIVEVKEGMKLEPNKIFLAPPNYHLLIGENNSLTLSDGVKVNYSRPSIDVMFKSIAKAFGRRTVGIILTGASNDGSEGIKSISRNGGLTIAQNPAIAEYNFMPQSAIDTGSVDIILDINEIAEFINRI